MWNEKLVFRLTSKRPKKVLEKICNKQLENIFYLDKRYKCIKLVGDNIWLADPFADRSWRFWLHCLVVLERLVDGYNEFRRKEYLDKAVEIVLDWKHYNFPRSESEMAWHDHSTALRLIELCNLFVVWRKCNWNKTIAAEFEELVSFHCQNLADPNFYMEKHNHGLDQDIALYVASTIFSELASAEEWRCLSEKRFWQQIEHLFAEDGSYREHSPQYGYLLLTRLFDFASFLEVVNDKNYRNLTEVINKHVKYLTYILLPNGNIPPIGDSMMEPINIDKWKAAEEQLANLNYVVSRGKRGRCPGTLDGVFPIGGYAVFRNFWEGNDKTVQVSLTCGFHSRVHKHRDDLSISVYAHNQPIIMDAGRFNYDYDSPGRKYVVSTVAHNTVLVDGKNTDIIRLNINKTGLTDYYLGDVVSMVAGKHCLYEGIIHQRVLVFFRRGTTFVIDKVKGYKTHRFEQVFNFAPNLSCKFEDCTVKVLRNQDCVAKLTPMTDGIEIVSYRGSENPFRGWMSVEYSKLEPAWSVGFAIEDKTAIFGTCILLTDTEEEPPVFKNTRDRVTFNYMGTNIDLILSDNVYMVLNDRLVETNVVSNPTLDQAVEEALDYNYREKYRAERKRRLALQERLEKKS